MAVQSKEDMLIEAGSNELQVMEFKIGGRSFGINVAKILEIMQYEPVMSIPHTSPYVEDVFKPRDKIITVVNLAAYLGLPESEHPERDIMIVTHFNSLTTAFHVHSVELIQKLSWTDLEKPDKTIYGGMETLAVGIARIEDRLITILDFEKVLSDIGSDKSFDPKRFETRKFQRQIQNDVFVVEDSSFLKEMIINCLDTAGYKNIRSFSNGQEAWDEIVKIKEENDDIFNHVSCIITDIEMPQMDGYTLLKKIKTDPVLAPVPVIIFSSLISDDMKIKGDSLGANAQVAKPEIEDLVEILDGYILTRNKNK